MTGWHEGPLLSLDFETAGVDPTSTFAVSVALCRRLPGEGMVSHQWLLQPPAGEVIPDGAARIHGITTERAVTDGQPAASALAQVRDAVIDWLADGRPVVAFNAAYDCTLLEHELARHGLPTITATLGAFAPVIDPFVLDKHLSRRKGSRKLEDQCRHYDVALDGAHDAGHDAIAAARVAWRIGQRYPAIAAMPLHELHEAQVDWRREQCDSLRAYFDRTGKEHDGVDGSWPVRVTEALQVAA